MIWYEYIGLCIEWRDDNNFSLKNNVKVEIINLNYIYFFNHRKIKMYNIAQMIADFTLIYSVYYIIKHGFFLFLSILV